MDDTLPLRAQKRYANPRVQQAIDAARSTARQHRCVMFVVLGRAGMFVSSKPHGGEVLYAVSPDGHVDRERRRR